MFEHYEKRERLSKRQHLGRWTLRFLFLGSFGFAGGVLFLLLFLVPVEKWLADRETAQQTVNLILTALILSWVLISLIATGIYDKLFVKRRVKTASLGVLAASLTLTGFVFFFLLDTDILLAFDLAGQEETEGERLTFGSYPDDAKLEELKSEGYDGVITLLNPEIPFERVLLQREQENGEKVGIPVRSYPMLPWLSQNQRSLTGIAELVGSTEGRYYIHCYLGKHRVQLARRELQASSDEPVTSRPLPDSFERGDLRSYDDGRVILGPLPTDEEWLGIILRKELDEVITTLDPASGDDARRIQEERAALEGSGITVTEMPLYPTSPDPQAVQRIADYAASTENDLYIHDFGYDNRAEALDDALAAALAGQTTQAVESGSGG